MIKSYRNLKTTVGNYFYGWLKIIRDKIRVLKTIDFLFLTFIIAYFFINRSSLPPNPNAEDHSSINAATMEIPCISSAERKNKFNVSPITLNYFNELTEEVFKWK